MTINLEINPEEYAAILEQAKQDALNGLRDKLVANIKSAAKYEVESMARKTVQDWFEKEMRPAIITALATQENAIANMALSMSAEIATATTSAIVKQMTDQLGTEYGRTAFLKAVLGIR